MSRFPIRRVDRNLAQSVEQLGSRPKFWFREGNRRLLFKADDRGIGDDWAEVVACHLCQLLGLPHVEYEFAIECDGSQELRLGVVCENMAPTPISLMLGNEMLLALDPTYPKEQRFKVRQHTVDAVTNVISNLRPPLGQWTSDLPAKVNSGLDVFIGYMMLDAWIANQDRHHENWAALIQGDQLYLAPTFDHGAALARNLLDGERADRIHTRDRNRTVAAFAARARSSFFHSENDQRPLGLLEAFFFFAQTNPEAANAWKERLRAVTQDAVQSILDRVPTQRMSQVCRQFTLELLLTNQRRLLN